MNYFVIHFNTMHFCYFARAGLFQPLGIRFNSRLFHNKVFVLTLPMLFVWAFLKCSRHFILMAILFGNYFEDCLSSMKKKRNGNIPICISGQIQWSHFQIKFLHQGGGSSHGLTQNLWFNSYHGLFLPLTPIVNTNTVSFKHLGIISHNN